VPIPFVDPDTPVTPANVVTSPVEITMCRMILLYRSATKAYDPSGEMATLTGALKAALLPTPFIEPTPSFGRIPVSTCEGVVPARVVTEAVERTMRRTKLLFESATKAKVPVGEM
jgi:hypothetical protein